MQHCSCADRRQQRVPSSTARPQGVTSRFIFEFLKSGASQRSKRAPQSLRGPRRSAVGDDEQQQITCLLARVMMRFMTRAGQTARMAGDSHLPHALHVRRAAGTGAAWRGSGSAPRSGSTNGAGVGRGITTGEQERKATETRGHSTGHTGLSGRCPRRAAPPGAHAASRFGFAAAKKKNDRFLIAPDSGGCKLRPVQKKSKMRVITRPSQ